MCLGLGLYLGRELRPFLIGVGKQGVDVLFTGIKAVLCGRRELGHVLSAGKYSLRESGERQRGLMFAPRAVSRESATNIGKLRSI